MNSVTLKRLYGVTLETQSSLVYKAINLKHYSFYFPLLLFLFCIMGCFSTFVITNIKEVLDVLRSVYHDLKAEINSPHKSYQYLQSNASILFCLQTCLGNCCSPGCRL